MYRAAGRRYLCLGAADSKAQRVLAVQVGVRQEGAPRLIYRLQQRHVLLVASALRTLPRVSADTPLTCKTALHEMLGHWCETGVHAAGVRTPTAL